MDVRPPRPRRRRNEPRRVASLADPQLRRRLGNPGVPAFRRLARIRPPGRRAVPRSDPLLGSLERAEPRRFLEGDAERRRLRDVVAGNLQDDQSDRSGTRRSLRRARGRSDRLLRSVARRGRRGIFRRRQHSPLPRRLDDGTGDSPFRKGYRAIHRGAREAKRRAETGLDHRNGLGDASRLRRNEQPRRQRRASTPVPGIDDRRRAAPESRDLLRFAIRTVGERGAAGILPASPGGLLRSRTGRTRTTRRRRKPRFVRRRGRLGKAFPERRSGAGHAAERNVPRRQIRRVGEIRRGRRRALLVGRRSPLLSFGYRRNWILQTGKSQPDARRRYAGAPSLLVRLVDSRKRSGNGVALRRVGKRESARRLSAGRQGFPLLRRFAVKRGRPFHPDP